MNKKGFTLIELLSVIILIGVIALLIIPNIDKLLKSTRDDLHNDQILMIEKAAKLWTIDNRTILDQNETWPYVILLKTLQEEEYIDKEIKNPKTDNNFDENLQIKIFLLDNGKYKYEVEK